MSRRATKITQSAPELAVSTSVPKWPKSEAEEEIEVQIMDDINCVGLTNDISGSTVNCRCHTLLEGRIRALETQSLSVVTQFQFQQLIDKCNQMEKRVMEIENQLQLRSVILDAENGTDQTDKELAVENEPDMDDPGPDSIDFVLSASPSPSTLTAESVYQCKICSCCVNFDSAKDLANHYTSQHPIPVQIDEENDIKKELHQIPRSLPVSDVFAKKDSKSKATTTRGNGSRLKFLCPDGCGRMCSDKRSLIVHLNACRGLKPFACDLCPTKFLTKNSMKAHKGNLHSAEGRVACPVCEKKVYKPSLKNHMKSHSEKLYICESCGSRFVTGSELKAHCRTHTGERPFDCPHCDKRFTDRTARNRHVLLHTGKPHVCDECGWTFTTTTELRRHKESHRRGTVQTVRPPARPVCTSTDEVIIDGSGKRRRKQIFRYFPKPIKPWQPLPMQSQHDSRAHSAEEVEEPRPSQESSE